MIEYGRYKDLKNYTYQLVVRVRVMKDSPVTSMITYVSIACLSEAVS